MAVDGAGSTPDQRVGSPLAAPIAVVLAACLAGLVTLAASVRYVTSDPSGSLLVAEQILVNRTVFLDAYAPDVLAGFWTFVPYDGHTSYFWALGSSLSSVPFVAVFRLAGLDVVALEPNLQIVVAAALAGATVVLLYAVARFFLRHGISLLLAVLFWLSSPLASVTGTALWSIDWAVVYGLASLLLALGAVHRGWRWAWLPLAVTLALGYVTRPTMALLVLVVLGYLLLRSRRTAALTILGLAACGLLWILFSLRTFGTWVPPYYQPNRLGGGDYPQALLGVLVSPGRGLLVYVPVLLLLALLIPLPRQPRWRDGWLAIAMTAWLGLLVLVVAGFPDWYGGWSYGPRLLTEAMPAVFVLLVLLWPDAFPTLAARAVLVALVVVAGWGVYVHTVQGLFNEWTQRWNWEPEVNSNREILWDWRYPPFLHDGSRHAERLADYPPAESLNSS